MERKYKQRGYADRDSQDKKRDRVDRPDRPDRPSEPRPKQDMLGPRTPRMVGTVMRARCSTCGAVLPPGFDPASQCPRCHAELHSCKQCVHFDTAAQFECTQPIPERIPRKDQRNDCTFYSIRVMVEKETSTPAALRPNDARQAFENLFKK